MASNSNKSKPPFESQKSTSSDEGSPVTQRKKTEDKAFNEAVELMSNYLDNGN